ncbi:hypothetical protein NC652_009156 [Populus alba x Populus x berolinensis]|nr:hypothetical protein NC652_009156 [Populus alba x Populus x berolinensis]
MIKSRKKMEEKREAGRAAVNVWDCGSPLYDSYEIASLGHVIDRHSLALPSPAGSRKEGRHVIQHSSMPGDQENGLEVKQEGALFKIIRVFSVRYCHLVAIPHHQVGGGSTNATISGMI